MIPQLPSTYYMPLLIVQKIYTLTKNIEVMATMRVDLFLRYIHTTEIDMSRIATGRKLCGGFCFFFGAHQFFDGRIHTQLPSLIITDKWYQ